MKRAYINNHPWRSLAWFLLAMLCLLLFVESWRYLTKPDLAHKDKIISRRLTEAATNFKKHQQKLLHETQQIAAELQEKKGPLSSMASYQILKNHSDLWSTVLVTNGSPVVWNGFSVQILQSVENPDSLNDYISIKKQNNTLFWLAHTAFIKKTEKDSAVYHLYSAQRIIQNNALKIGREQEYNFLSDGEHANNYLLGVSIFDSPPDKKISYKVLTDVANDSVGIVYAVQGHFKQLLQHWHKTTNQWRSYFIVFFFAVFLLFITFWLDLKSMWLNLLIRLLFIAIGWFFFNYVSISTRWLPDILAYLPPDLVASYQHLFSFTINAVFFFLVAYAIHYTFRESRRTYRKFGKMASIIGGFVIGVASMGIIFIAIQCGSSLTRSTSFSLLNLQILPSVGVMILYLGLGVSFWGVTLLVLNINRFIFRVCRDHYQWAFLLSIASFIMSYGAASIYYANFSFNWAFYTGLILFILIGGLSFVYFKYPVLVRQSSILRRAAAATLILAITGTPIIYFGELDNQDEMLAEVAKRYSQQDDQQAKELVSHILDKLQFEFRTFSLDSLQAKPASIKSDFNEIINANTTKTNALYKLHFQLVTKGGNRIATYSNALDVPEWVDYFKPARFYATILMQGINKNYITPVIQQPRLVNQENYETFYRGWIPLFSAEANRPIAWIIGSVYQKRVDIKKPMQALVASYNYRRWDESMLIQHYKNGELIATVNKGTNEQYPIYNQLPVHSSKFQNDSLFYYNSSNRQHTYRNLVITNGNQNTLKISAIIAGFDNILFSFFRLHLTLLLAGFAALLIVQFIKTGKVELIKRNTQFQYRILDSFLLATLGFLILMIAGTYFALNWQNKNFVKKQLYSNLESINLASNKLRAVSEEKNIASLLQSSIELQTDASFYIGQEVVKSTTPQVYQQHLLPSGLPFPVYYQLYKNQKRSIIQSVKLSGQQLFLGYRLLSANAKPVATVAIPAFTQSPVYKSRLLEISSFLVLLYVLIFTIFIAGAIFISRQLTKPLYKIRQGLHQISKGDLDTTIPVESRDEIGILAASYNRMTKRLKKLQAELAQREREAAWKEIAREAAHEIKNPLTPMKLNIQHLKHQASSGQITGEELKKKIVQITENILVQIDALNTIAFNFLSYSTSTDSDFQTVDVGKLVRQIAALHKNMDHSKLQVNIDNSFAGVEGVEEELHGAIFNLIKNAYEASGMNDVIIIDAFSKAGSYFVKVHNQGEVIPDDMREDIFKPNFSTKSEGTGLGLAICKKVVTKHNGTISFESNEEKGTTFIIGLPLAEQED